MPPCLKRSKIVSAQETVCVFVNVCGEVPQPLSLGACSTHCLGGSDNVVGAQVSPQSRLKLVRVRR